MSQTTSERLAGRIAVVTGAGSGIGRAAAIRLAAEGAHVILIGRTESTLRETATQIGDAAAVVCGDVGRETDNERMADLICATHPRIDILVNNAAIYFRGSTEELKTDDLRRMLDVNFVGQVDLTRRLLPLLRQGQPSGCVINISSTATLSSGANNLAYSTAKAALEHATRTMAAEWGPQVRVNCICPGFVDTAIHRARGLSEAEVQAFLDSLGEQHPLRRVGQPDDIAAAIAYLASDDAVWVTGSTLVVDGGFSVSGG